MEKLSVNQDKEHNLNVTSILTVRSLSTGLILAILLNIWVTFGTYILHTSRMSVSHLPIAALAIFLALTFLYNPLARILSKKAAFTGRELALIFCILLISSLIPGKAFISYFLTIISTPFYFAQPENQWADLFIPFLPEWLVASNQNNAMGWFYEGLPPGTAIPWSPWIIPVAWWMSFFVAIFFVGACIAAIFRKQWVDYERLTFPLVQVPLELISQAENSKRFPNLVYDRLFQMGFLLALGIALWNIIAFTNAIPSLPIGTFFQTPLQLSPLFPSIPLRISPYMLSFAYFINVDILLSIWVFFMLGIFEIGALSYIGLNMGSSGPGGSGGVNAQFFGGFLVYVGYSLWTARKHLLAVLKKAMGYQPKLDDSKELVSYRAALVGLLVGSAYICAWLYQAGISLPVMLVFLAFLFVLYFGTTKVIAETGVVFLDLPVNAHQITVLSLGSGNISQPSLTSLGLTSAFGRNWRGLGMGSVVLIDRLTDGLWKSKKGLLLVLTTAFIVSMITAVSYSIYWGYSTGAYNFGGGAFNGLNKSYYDEIVTWIKNPLSLGQNEPWFMAAGAIIFVLLLKLRHLLIWWPLAPVGFAICFASNIRDSILSIFIAWLAKFILLKLGTSAYRTGQRFFIGILIGYTAGVVLAFLVDAIFYPGQGHMIHDW